MSDHPKAPGDMADQELINEYEAIDAEAGADPRAEALLAEIERRDLDL